MSFHFDILHWLLLAAIAGNVLAAGLMLAGALTAKSAGRALRAAAWAAFALSFAVNVAAFALRWTQVHHLPMQNLFETFLAMGMFMLPVAAFSRLVLKTGAEAFDPLLSAVVLVPAAFVFSAEPQALPPILRSPLFAPHVAAYLLAYMILAKAAMQAALQLIRQRTTEAGLVDYETGAYRLVCLGFPLLTLGLVLGSVWGKLAWGDWWNWDPKELWSLASWLAYVLYLHLRPRLRPRLPWLNSALALLGLAFIILTLLWVNLSRLFPGMHSYAS